MDNASQRTTINWLTTVLNHRAHFATTTSLMYYLRELLLPRWPLFLVTNDIDFIVETAVMIRSCNYKTYTECEISPVTQSDSEEGNWVIGWAWFSLSAAVHFTLFYDTEQKVLREIKTSMECWEMLLVLFYFENSTLCMTLIFVCVFFPPQLKIENILTSHKSSIQIRIPLWLGITKRSVLPPKKSLKMRKFSLETRKKSWLEIVWKVQFNFLMGFRLKKSVKRGYQIREICIWYRDNNHKQG